MVFGTTSSPFAGTSRFEVVRLLGGGGMGLVYEVLDRERNERVALKTVRSFDGAELTRLKAEFRAIREVHHPNLVSLYELAEEGGVWFFTMELIEGVTFLQHVRFDDGPPAGPRAGGDGAPNTDPSGSGPSRDAADAASPGSPLSDEGQTAPPADESGEPAPSGRVLYDEGRLRAALRQLASGLDAVHRAGKVHRDVKPSNILVTPQDRLVLLDFGLATDVAPDERSIGLYPVGTVAYMAPEQAAGRPVGPEADWYSVGVILFEALTGQVPFVGSPLAVMCQKQESTPPRPISLVPGVPADLDALCVDLMQAEPGHRPTGPQILERLGVREHPAWGGVTASLTQAPRFVGRTEELAILHEAFRATERGESVVLLVEGESGVGKTALARRLAEELRGHNVLTLTGRCYEREAVPYRAIDGVVDGLGRYMAHLPEDQASVLLPRDAHLLGDVFPALRGIRAVAGAPRRSGRSERDPHEQRTRLFAAVRELVVRLTDRRRLLLVIDDLQWADADSLALLAEVLRPPDAPALLCLMLARPDGAEQGKGLSEIEQYFPRSLRRLTLGRLPPADARELATLLLQQARPVAGVSAEAIVTEAGGHPLFIDELVRHAGLGSAAPTGPLRLDDALRSRALSLPPAALRLLEVVTVAARPLRLDILAEVAGLGSVEFTRALGVLRAGNLVRTGRVGGREAVEPYHDRVRQAVVAALEPEAQRAYHRELAVAMEATAQTDQEAIAVHWEGAGERVRAASLAARAGDEAASALAFDRAAKLYQTALALGDHAPAERANLLMRLGRVLAYAGRGVKAAEVCQEAGALTSGAERRECRRWAAEQLLQSGYVEEGLKEIDAALAEVGERLPRTPRRALLSLLWQRLRLKLRGLRWVEHEESEIRGIDLVKHDTFKAVALGLGVVDTIRAADFQARCLRLALKAGERRRVGRAIAQEAMFVVTQGNRSVAKAQRLLAEAQRIAEESGDAYLRAWATGAAGLCSYFAGRYPEAGQFLREAEALLREQTVGTWWEIDNVRLFRVMTLRIVGTLDELSRLASAWVLDAGRRGDRYAETTLVRQANVAWLGRDDPDQAQRELASRGWSPPEGGYHLQHWYETRAIVERQLYVDEMAGAAERVREALEGLGRSLLLRVQIVRCEARWLCGRVALREARDGGKDARTLKLAAKMARLVERERAPFAKVWGGLLRAGVTARAGDRAGAAGCLEEVIRNAAQHSMLLCAAVARRRRGELLGGEEGAALVREADAWMAEQGVCSPARFTEVFAPDVGRGRRE